MSEGCLVQPRSSHPDMENVKNSLIFSFHLGKPSTFWEKDKSQADFFVLQKANEASKIFPLENGIQLNGFPWKVNGTNLSVLFGKLK